MTMQINKLIENTVVYMRYDEDNLERFRMINPRIEEMTFDYDMIESSTVSIDGFTNSTKYTQYGDCPFFSTQLKTKGWIFKREVEEVDEKNPIKTIASAIAVALIIADLAFQESHLEFKCNEYLETLIDTIYFMAQTNPITIFEAGEIAAYCMMLSNMLQHRKREIIHTLENNLHAEL